MNLELAEYIPKIATIGQIDKAGNVRRGCVILVEPETNAMILKNRSVGNVELIGIKIVGNPGQTLSNPFELWTAYCGPYSTESTKFTTMLKKLHNEKTNRILLAGDLNARYHPITNNHQPHTQGSRQLLELLYKLEDDGEATILNEFGESTTTANTTIDLAITLGRWEEGFAYPIPCELGSNHYPVCIGIITNLNKPNNSTYINIPRYCRSKQEENKIIKLCKKKCTEIETSITETKSNPLAQEILNFFKPKKLPRTKKLKRKKNHWWNKEIKNHFLLKQKHLVKCRCAKNKCTELKEIEEKLYKMISEEKNKSFQEYASGLDHRNSNISIFKAIKTLNTRQPSMISQLALRDTSGAIIADSQKKADILSRQYQTPLGFHPTRSKDRRQQLKARRKMHELEAITLEKMRSTNHPPANSVIYDEDNHPSPTAGAQIASNSVKCDDDHHPFTTAEAQIALNEMANNKAPGLSRICKEDLKLGGKDMAKLLAYLGDAIVRDKAWPICLKTNGIDCPTLKNDKTIDFIEVDGTRPITLLEVIDKWIQKMIYNRISKFVQFHEAQAGYCYNCDYHTTAITDYVMNRSDKPYVIAAFTDISKAFDSVPLNELVDVIWASNIPTPYKWVVASFVEKRQYRVEIRDMNGNVSASKWRKKLFGTPQGSVLGPILWNLFFDPLLSELDKLKIGPIHTNTTDLDDLDTVYADDLTLLAASSSPQVAAEHLEKKLEIFKDFLDKRGMVAASHKLKVMCLDPHRRNHKPIVRISRHSN